MLTSYSHFYRCVRQSDLADKMRGYFNVSVTPNQLEEKVNIRKHICLHYKGVRVCVCTLPFQASSNCNFRLTQLCQSNFDSKMPDLRRPLGLLYFHLISVNCLDAK